MANLAFNFVGSTTEVFTSSLITKVNPILQAIDSGLSLIDLGCSFYTFNKEKETTKKLQKINEELRTEGEKSLEKHKTSKIYELNQKKIIFKKKMDVHKKELEMIYEKVKLRASMLEKDFKNQLIIAQEINQIAIQVIKTLNLVLDRLKRINLSFENAENQLKVEEKWRETAQAIDKVWKDIGV
ncbi:hypothetical protein [Veillonella caviae]|uniref:hypothetical protein n=1 Tax=Veillonella caviae TaxID=248316 RepID=UPI0023F8FEC2|nr:hypothetical protein [Veillonella caviae]